jgi:iron(III) transport system permease protein
MVSTPSKKGLHPFSKVDAYRGPLLALLVLFIIVPLVTLFASLKGADFSYVFSDAGFHSAVLNSFLYSLAGSLIAVFCSLLAAYFLSRSRIKGKSLWALALTSPMLVPTLSIGLGIRSLFGTNGFLDQIFHLEIDGSGFLGLIIGSAVSAFPVTFLLIYDAIRYESKGIYDAGETLGIKRFQSFFYVTLPYLRFVLVGAFFAGFTWIFSDYGVPMEVAGKVPTLPMYLYEQVLTQYEYGRGAVVGLVLLIPALAAFVCDLFKKENPSEESSEQIIPPTRGFNILSYCIVILTFLLVALPELSFIVLAFVQSFPNEMSLTFQHVADAFGTNTGLGVGKYLGNSILMAVLTGIFGVFVAYLAAYFSSRYTGFLGKAIDFVCLASLAIPGLVFGLGYVFLFKFSKGWFYSTLGILVAVNCVHFLATPYLMAKNAFAKINQQYETIGDTIGVSRFKVFLHVLIPNSRSTLIEMFSFFFINAMITISAVAFLCTYSNQPLSILINTYEKQGSYEMQAVVSFIILLVNVAAKGLLSLASHEARKREMPKEDVYMALSRYQFDFLTYLEKKGPVRLTQRQLADALTVSLGLINKTMHDFLDEGAIQVNEKMEISLTDKGLKLLEPYKVRKAVVIAAGFGSRLAPVTLDTPKPLVKVNGVRIIDTLLDALYAQGIKSIFIVRGYKGEQFDELLKKYPTIKFIENPLYNESNNISSIDVALDVLDRCYICEADLIVSDPSVITKYQYTTNYLATPVKETDDWCFSMRGPYIHKVEIGGENVEQMIGISYWSEADSKKLREDVAKVFASRGGKENYWDNVPLKICRKDFKIEIRECKRSAVTEIDNYSELLIIDPSYANYQPKK